MRQTTAIFRENPIGREVCRKKDRKMGLVGLTRFSVVREGRT